MGLDTTHDCWHGAYPAFTRWRNKLAEVAGYKLEKQDGSFIDLPVLPWDSFPYDWPAGEWGDHVERDPLVYLLAHSDCEGAIHPPQAAPLADRLEELLPLLPDGDAGGHIGVWRDKTRRFIDGLRLAVSIGEDVEFH
jgi:hypothetical protein